MPKAKPEGFRWTYARRRAVQVYARTGDWNEACRSSGLPSENWRSWHDHPEVVDYTEREFRAAMSAAEESETNVLQRLVSWANGNVYDYLEFDHGVMRGDHGVRIKDPAKIPKAKQQRVKKISVTAGQFGQSVTVELYDAMKANEMLAKFFGLLTTEDPEKELTAAEKAKSLRDLVRQMRDVDGISDADKGSPETTTH